MDKDEQNKSGGILPFNRKSKIIDDLGTNEYGTQPMADRDTINVWGPFQSIEERMFPFEFALTEEDVAFVQYDYAEQKRKILKKQIGTGLFPEGYQQEIAHMICEASIERFNSLGKKDLGLYINKNRLDTPESQQYSREAYIEWLRSVRMEEINNSPEENNKKTLLFALKRQEAVIRGMLSAEWKDRVALSVINGRLFESKHFTWAKEALEKKESSSAGGFLYSMDTMRVEMPEEFLEAVIWMVDEGALKPEEAVELARNGTLKYIAHFDAKDLEGDLNVPTAE